MTSKAAFYKAPRYVFRKHNILNILKTVEAKTFLDVGCGAGELACTLAEKGYKGTAVDFSENAIEIANNLRDSRNIKKGELKFHLGGLENVQGKKFDIVSCFEVLEHVEKDKELLRAISGHSKKYVLISVPAKQKLYDTSDKAVGHFRRYEKHDLLDMLHEAELDVVHFINYGYPFTDIVRVARKLIFSLNFRKKQSDSMKNRSKDSGINPIKLPKIFSKIDTEKLLAPFFHLSRPFNKYNLSEGYLVLCEKRA